MKISTAEISFSTHHSVVQKHVRRESLVEGVSQDGIWEPSRLVDGKSTVREEEQAVAFEENSSLLDQHLSGRGLEELTARQQTQANALRPQDALSQRAIDDLDLLVQKTANPFSVLLPVEGIVPFTAGISSEDKIKIQLLIATIESLNGKRLKLFEPNDLEITPSEPVAPETPQEPPTEKPENREPVWGLRYLYHESHYEAETTTFNAKGVVRTQDGQEVEIDIDLTMSRQFASEKSLDIRLGGALQDPLVVNFEGTAAELTQTKYNFDLDSNGQEEQIHFIGPNSGFLAVDANDNGIIDDGSELFGPTTGDGFAELAVHDQDQNLWIDENDSIYSHLRIWSKDLQGNDQLIALGQRGVGAIYLGHATTPFEVKGEENQLQAVVRSSGLYLNEDGSAGSVQQVDLVV